MKCSVDEVLCDAKLDSINGKIWYENWQIDTHENGEWGEIWQFWCDSYTDLTSFALVSLGGGATTDLVYGSFDPILEKTST